MSSAERYKDIKHKFQDPWQLHRTEALLQLEQFVVSTPDLFYQLADQLSEFNLCTILCLSQGNMVGLKTARCAFEAQFTLLNRLKDLSEYFQATDINTVLHSQFYE